MSKAPDEEFCKSCGEPVKKAAVRCPNCGVNTEDGPASDVGEVYCESCGESIKAAAEICPECGVGRSSSSRGGSTRGGSGLDGDVAYWVQVCFGALFLLAALGSVTDFSDGVAASLVGFVLYGTVGLVLIPQVRERIDKRHPVTTFGWTTSVEETSVSNPAEPCSSCFESIDSGVRRSYGKEFVVAGFALSTKEEGANHYCRSCLAVEQGADPTIAESVEVETES